MTEPVPYIAARQVQMTDHGKTVDMFLDGAYWRLVPSLHAPPPFGPQPISPFPPPAGSPDWLWDAYEKAVESYNFSCDLSWAGLPWCIGIAVVLAVVGVLTGTR